MELRQSKIESGALYFGGLVAVISAGAALAYFWGTVVPLFGSPSIGSVGSALAAVAAFVGFLLSCRPALPENPAWYHMARRVLTGSALAFTYAAICLLLGIAAFFLTQSAFQGVKLDAWTSAVLVGLTAGTAGYAGLLAGSRLTSERLALVLAVFLASGGLVSMISAPNPYWWQIHFSSLGGGQSVSAAAFNLTLVVAGLVVVGLADLIAADFTSWQIARHEEARRSANMLRVGLACMGLALACVGIFAYDTHLAAHNIAAGAMAILFMYLAIALPQAAPGLPRAFQLFSYALVAGLLAGAWLYLGKGYLNLTAFELITTGIIFAWLIVFVRNLAAGLADARLAMVPSPDHKLRRSKSSL